MSLTGFLAFVEGLLSLLALCIFSFVHLIKLKISGGNTGAEDAAKATHELWSIENENSPVKHAFLALPDGLRLHYLTPRHSRQHRHLIVFLHGFPDSCYLWTRFFHSPLCDHASLVFLDLPGFGGSDSLPDYSPDHILTTIDIAVTLLKQRYLVEEEPGHLSGSCVLVGHDWGGIVASRIAAARNDLVDHLVMVNSLFPPHFLASLKQRMKRSSALSSAWTHDLRRVDLLQSGLQEAAIVLSQILRSHYVFLINLPFFSAQRFPFIMDFIVCTCHRVAGSRPYLSAVRDGAASLGPGVRECEGHDHGSPTYGCSVTARATYSPNRIWDERMGLYKNGLIRTPWTRRIGSKEGQASTSTEPVDEGQIRCHTTVVFGLKDEALDHRIAVDGMSDFISPQANGGCKGQVITMDSVGHWSPLHPLGSRMIEELLMRRITGAEQNENMHTNDTLFAGFDGVQVRELK